jgi:hypothetical protein
VIGRRWRATVGTGEQGQLSLLILGYTLIAFCLVAVVVDATSVHLARTQLRDAADAAALDAADALGAGVYGQTLPDAVPLTDRAVRDQAASDLRDYDPPTRLDQVELAPGTGTLDGRSATVVLTGRARIPLAASVVASFTGGVMISVTSTARAELR